MQGLDAIYGIYWLLLRHKHQDYVLLTVQMSQPYMSSKTSLLCAIHLQPSLHVYFKFAQPRLIDGLLGELESCKAPGQTTGHSQSNMAGKKGAESSPNLMTLGPDTVCLLLLFLIVAYIFLLGRLPIFSNWIESDLNFFFFPLLPCLQLA